MASLTNPQVKAIAVLVDLVQAVPSHEGLQHVVDELALDGAGPDGAVVARVERGALGDQRAAAGGHGRGGSVQHLPRDARLASGVAVVDGALITLRHGFTSLVQSVDRLALAFVVVLFQVAPAAVVVHPGDDQADGAGEASDRGTSALALGQAGREVLGVG